MVFGSYTLHRKLTSLIKVAEDAKVEGKNLQPVDPDLFAADLSDQLNLWVSVTLFLVHNCAPRSIGRQLFAHTFFLDSRGLSKRGRQVLARHGLCQSWSSYRDRMHQEVSTTEAVLR